MNRDHPVLQECYEAKARLSQELGPHIRAFAHQMREREAAARAQGIKFTDLSNKEPSAYAKRMASGTWPKNYWQRQPVRPFFDPIEEEIKAIETQARAAKRTRAVATA